MRHFLLFLFFCGCTTSMFAQHLFSPFAGGHTTEDILNQQTRRHATADKSLNAVKERIRYMSYRTGYGVDSTAFYYSNNRGMSRPIHLFSSALSDALDVNMYGSYTTYLFYDSTTRYTTLTDSTGGRYFIVFEKNKREYDSSNYLTSHTHFDYWGDYKKATYTNNMQGIPQSIYYTMTDSGIVYISVPRVIHYNTHGLPECDSLYGYNNVTHYEYDSLNRLVRRTAENTDTGSSANFYGEIDTYTYDSLNRITGAVQYNKDVNTHLWGGNVKDSFNYIGSSTNFSTRYMFSYDPDSSSWVIMQLETLSPALDTFVFYWYVPTLTPWNIYTMTYRPSGNLATLNMIYCFDSLSGVPTRSATTYYYETYTDSTITPPPTNFAKPVLFPNPANNYFTLQFANADNLPVQILVVSSTGIRTTELYLPGGTSAIVPTSRLQTGSYFVKILVGGKPMETVQFIKAEQ